MSEVSSRATVTALSVHATSPGAMSVGSTDACNSLTAPAVKCKEDSNSEKAHQSDRKSTQSQQRDQGPLILTWVDASPTAGGAREKNEGETATVKGLLSSVADKYRAQPPKGETDSVTEQKWVAMAKAYCHQSQQLRDLKERLCRYRALYGQVCIENKKLMHVISQASINESQQRETTSIENVVKAKARNESSRAKANTRAPPKASGSGKSPSRKDNWGPNKTRDKARSNGSKTEWRWKVCTAPGQGKSEQRRPSKHSKKPSKHSKRPSKRRKWNEMPVYEPNEGIILETQL